MINDWFDINQYEARLPASWRGRPGSFVSLMSLYESNHQRLRALAGDLRPLTGERQSRVEGDCLLVLRIIDQAPYTTEFELTYELSEGSAPSAPDMLVRLYHDARLVEAHGWSNRHEHPWLSELRRHSGAALDQRWARNIMLNKWLEYCLERGHCLKEPDRVG